MNRHLAKCGGHRDFGSVDISLFICHAASNDHVIKWSNEFASWCPAKSGGNKSCGGTDIIYFISPKLWPFNFARFFDIFGIAKCDRLLLQSASGITHVTEFITKCVRYCKV